MNENEQGKTLLLMMEGGDGEITEEAILVFASRIYAVGNLNAKQPHTMLRTQSANQTNREAVRLSSLKVDWWRGDFPFP